MKKGIFLIMLILVGCSSNPPNPRSPSGDKVPVNKEGVDSKVLERIFS
jgi:uncharacterized protein YcfL